MQEEDDVEEWNRAVVDGGELNPTASVELYFFSHKAHMLFDAYLKAKIHSCFYGWIIVRTANSPWPTDERRRCVAKFGIQCSHVHHREQNKQ